MASNLSRGGAGGSGPSGPTTTSGFTSAERTANNLLLDGPNVSAVTANVAEIYRKVGPLGTDVPAGTNTAGMTRETLTLTEISGTEIKITSGFFGFINIGAGHDLTHGSSFSINMIDVFRNIVFNVQPANTLTIDDNAGAIQFNPYQVITIRCLLQDPSQPISANNQLILTAYPSYQGGTISIRGGGGLRGNNIRIPIEEDFNSGINFANNLQQFNEEAGRTQRRYDDFLWNETTRSFTNTIGNINTSIDYILEIENQQSDPDPEVNVLLTAALNDIPLPLAVSTHRFTSNGESHRLQNNFSLFSKLNDKIDLRVSMFPNNAMMFITDLYLDFKLA